VTVIPTFTCRSLGLKHLRVEMGLFSTNPHFRHYPLTPARRRTIARALIREKEILFP
jgi:hypothetical protein